jgi:hypothetical protein
MVMSLGPHDEPPLPLPSLSPAQASGREWFAAMRTTYGMGCTRQVDTGVYSFITGYANPRFPIVDTKRQIVFAVFNFRRRGTVKTVTMPNGKTYDMMPSTQWPNEVLNTEGWKFVNGKITRIEAVFKADQNFGAGTGWSGGLPGESRPVTTREARR